jgi:hypothetical protein
MSMVLATALIVVALIWVSPVIGTHNSICERDPYTSGCR